MKSNYVDLPQWSGIYQSPIGWLGIRAAQDTLLEVTLLPEKSTKAIAPSDKVTEQTFRWLDSYFKNPRHKLALPKMAIAGKNASQPLGTDFQRRVWQAIADIPCGEVKSYGRIAREINSGPRPVGTACGANYFLLLIPCHRVVSSTSLGGFGGNRQQGDAQKLLDVKRWLLNYEGVNINHIHAQDAA
jgi:methylated-DNA-[protein]-cysteine S-methyltransferase